MKKINATESQKEDNQKQHPKGSTYCYVELQDEISNADFMKQITTQYPAHRIVRLIRKKEEIFQKNDTHITDLSTLNVFTEIYRHEMRQRTIRGCVGIIFGD